MRLGQMAIVVGVNRQCWKTVVPVVVMAYIVAHLVSEMNEARFIYR